MSIKLNQQAVSTSFFCVSTVSNYNQFYTGLTNKKGKNKGKILSVARMLPLSEHIRYVHAAAEAAVLAAVLEVAHQSYNTASPISFTSLRARISDNLQNIII